MLKPDSWIKQKALEERMIEPFEERLVRDGCISYGLSCYGYDLRLADEFYTRQGSSESGGLVVNDPKSLVLADFTRYRGESFLIPANSYILARSLEFFRIPRNVMAIVQGKSTYARSGLLVNVTPLEAGWEGYITMALGNLSAVPIKIYADEGIAQALFFESDPCSVSYADRGGKYQGQQGVTAPKL